MALNAEQDLSKSGLISADIKARPLGDAERAACNIPPEASGYVIPYFDLNGTPVPFYRAKLLWDNPKVRYLQPKSTTAWLYYPPGFLKAAQNANYVVLTEGEKKAAALVKVGIPCCALGGVDSWRTRQIVMPDDTELSKITRGTNKFIAAKIKPGTEGAEEQELGLAKGLPELMAYLFEGNKHVVICYDSDGPAGIKYEVARAAAVLGFEFRFRGIPFNRVRQLILPPNASGTPGGKAALDDLLVHHGANYLRGLIQSCLARRSAFPRYPNLREYIAKKLEHAQGRKQAQQVSLAILADLDSRGTRLRTKDGSMFYFDKSSGKLMPVNISQQDKGAMHESAFGRYLYREYGLSTADLRVVEWLSAQFSGEDPIDEVRPHRVLARTSFGDDCVRYQINDAQYVKVTANADEPIQIMDNGKENTLFISEQVIPLDTSLLMEEFEEQHGSQLSPWWETVLADVCLAGDDIQVERDRKILTLLYYLSPWLYRWRGMQLPIELVCGESGSGKSTLMELRLEILLGESRLRNAPNDLKDWQAQASTAGGLLVTDNVMFADKQLRQRLSDELCRLVTEPDPHIEQRRYYTNAELIRIPVTACFALTAITIPFPNVDLLQRSIIARLDKEQRREGQADVQYDGQWKRLQLARRSGRTAWVAHHLLVLHKFFAAVRKEWNPTYRASHRLIHFEQSLRIMARMFGWDDTWIPGHLVAVANQSTSETDWAMEGIKAFCDEWNQQQKKGYVCASDIADWASMQDDYEECTMLTNSRSLGKYIQNHKNSVVSICGLEVVGKRNNKTTFLVRPAKSS